MEWGFQHYGGEGTACSLTSSWHHKRYWICFVALNIKKHASALGPPSLQRSSLPSAVCGKLKADIGFLVDESSSIGQSNFNKVKDFLFRIISYFPKIGPEGTQARFCSSLSRRCFPSKCSPFAHLCYTRAVCSHTCCGSERLSALPKDMYLSNKDTNRSLLNVSLLIWIYFHFLVIFPRPEIQQE